MHTTRRPSTTLLAAVIAAALAACSTHSPAIGDASRRDSSGVTIVHLEPVSDSGVPLWSSTPRYSTQGLDSLQLSGVDGVHARFDVDGALLLANFAEIVRLGPDGTFVKRIARRGDGPGEFRSIFGFGIAADGSLFGAEYGSGRVTLLTPNGELVRVVNRVIPAPGPNIPIPIAVLSSGKLLVLPWQWKPNVGQRPGIPAGAFVRDSVLFLAYGADGRVTDTLGLWSGVERFQGVVIPFTRSAAVAARGDATVIGATDSLDLSLFAGTSLRLRLVAPGGGRAPTPAERERRDSAIIREMPDVGAVLVKLGANVPGPLTLPVIGGLVLDDASNIWVGDYAVPGTRLRRWRIFSPQGALLGRIELPVFQGSLMPSRTELLDVHGDRLALLSEGEDGEIIVTVRTFTRR